MTSGYDPHPAPGPEPYPGAPVPGQRQPTEDGPDRTAPGPGQWSGVPGSPQVEPVVEVRPGPLPPRMEPPRTDPTAPLTPPPAPGTGYGPVPAPGYGPASGPGPVPAHGPVSAPAHGAVSGSGYGPASAPVHGPGSESGYGPASVSAPGYGPVSSGPAYAPAPGTGYGPPGYPYPPVGVGEPAPKARRRLAWPGVTALLLVLALAGAVGFQAYQIDRLTGRLADTDRRLAEAQRADGARLDGIEGQTRNLEDRAGQVFNPEAISSAVLPSVFRVRAGQFTGTAFAVGKPTANGGTNLFTNFHVVEELWNGGGRQVFLERTDQRFPATIVKVDKANDVAQLSTDGTFTGLVAAPEVVKSGQQIVVVGAPLGLEDSVTTGVVSAFRDNEDGPGKVIQFDAPINPGNSGGPVINGAKQVVGIATAKARDAEGIGLAVPIKTACDGFKIC
ncbi:S1C family serine protease [Micromonospora sp. NBC_01796]|uniref:S1C family serine protease n=1 Tax=Micromonospora sp. NBC_01796 TaxID=2975987 RepID=UPI002DDB02D0|nr:trypsin-like peptidase domain-containing protein [Micromonospora sp. NBC_01796]WSA86851.1 trypsin-like peptidase domain-containing protein [Micromonospora sp. NBC_01796]